MTNPTPQTVYDAVGESGVTDLVKKFYALVPADDILSPMYAHSDLGEAESRLRGFLIYRLGGPDGYITERGHPRLRIRHAPFVINPAARDRWLQLMTAALNEMRFPQEIDATLRAFFAETATFLINHPA